MVIPYFCVRTIALEATDSGVCAKSSEVHGGIDVLMNPCTPDLMLLAGAQIGTAPEEN